jgi:hypothetical protein
MPTDGRTPPDGSGAALYIASLAEELAKLAQSHKLEALAYILNMARLEADHVSKTWSAPSSPPSRPRG